MVILNEWGFNDSLSAYAEEHFSEEFSVGRVIAEQKDRYTLIISSGKIEAEVTGNLRFSAQSKSDFPVVGDWVVLMLFENFGIIHEIIPRLTLLERKSVGKKTETQPIASNVDVAFVVMSMTEDFNLNRLDRYLTIIHESKIRPIILLSKMDLVPPDEIEEKVHLVSDRSSATTIAIDNLAESGYDKLKPYIIPGETYCVIGSSGVGKTTLINHLANRQAETKNLSESTHKGMHTTTSRELVQIQNGGLLIDTPGMREIGIGGSAVGLSMAFSDITELAQSCKFADCTHFDEPGCAVLKAIQSGTLDPEVFDNFLKLEKESAHFQTTLVEKRKKDKAMGKMYKEVINFKKRTKR